MSEEGIKGELEAAKRLIVSAAIASCNCNTKSPEPVHHEPTCRYWKLMCALERVEGAEEDGAAVEAKLAAIIDNINRYGLTQVPAGEKRPELEELRRLIGPYAPMVEAWNRRADPAPQPVTSTVEVEGDDGEAAYEMIEELRSAAKLEHTGPKKDLFEDAAAILLASRRVLSAALEDKKRAMTAAFNEGYASRDDVVDACRSRAEKAEAALRFYRDNDDMGQVARAALTKERSE